MPGAGLPLILWLRPSTQVVQGDGLQIRYSWVRIPPRPSVAIPEVYRQTVGINDFLALLGEWGSIGSPCDLGLGAVGVGIEEFLDLLANRGPWRNRQTQRT